MDLRIEGLHGYEGILVAVLVRAVRDVKDGNGHCEEALNYFRSDNYRADMFLLGMDCERLPEVVEGLV